MSSLIPIHRSSPPPMEMEWDEAEEQDFGDFLSAGATDERNCKNHVVSDANLNRDFDQGFTDGNKGNDSNPSQSICLEEKKNNHDFDDNFNAFPENFCPEASEINTADIFNNSKTFDNENVFANEDKVMVSNSESSGNVHFDFDKGSTSKDTVFSEDTNNASQTKQVSNDSLTENTENSSLGSLTDLHDQSDHENSPEPLSFKPTCFTEEEGKYLEMQERKEDMDNELGIQSDILDITNDYSSESCLEKVAPKSEGISYKNGDQIDCEGDADVTGQQGITDISDSSVSKDVCDVNNESFHKLEVAEDKLNVCNQTECVLPQSSTVTDVSVEHSAQDISHLRLTDSSHIVHQSSNPSSDENTEQEKHSVNVVQTCTDDNDTIASSSIEFENKVETSAVTNSDMCVLENEENCDLSFDSDPVKFNDNLKEPETVEEISNARACLSTDTEGSNQHRPDIDSNSSNENNEASNSLSSKKNISNITETYIANEQNNTNAFSEIECNNKESVSNTSHHENISDKSIINDSDFGDFGEAQPENTFAAFENNKTEEDSSGWADFGDEEDNNDDWAVFSGYEDQSEDNAVTDTNKKQSDESFQNFAHFTSQSKKAVSVDSAVESSFPILNGNSNTSFINTGLFEVLSKENKIPKEVIQTIPGSRFRETKKSTLKVDVNVWNNIKGMENSQGLKFQWNSSNASQMLLKAINIDTRNMLLGHKTSSMPIFASGLGLLEPKSKSSSLDNSLISDRLNKASDSQNTLVDVNKTWATNSGNIDKDFPPIDFDWNGSGLTNPLDAQRKEQAMLEALEEPKQSKHNSAIQPLENILANMKFTSTTVSSSSFTTSDQNLSNDANDIVKNLPNLSFMQAKVLMFPLRPISKDKESMMLPQDQKINGGENELDQNSVPSSDEKIVEMF